MPDPTCRALVESILCMISFVSTGGQWIVSSRLPWFLSAPLFPFRLVATLLWWNGLRYTMYQTSSYYHLFLIVAMIVSSFWLAWTLYFYLSTLNLSHTFSLFCIESLCITIDSFNDFKRKIDQTSGTIVFCPFEIVWAAGDHEESTHSLHGIRRVPHNRIQSSNSD